MTAANHALTGTAIGLVIGQPILALPLALISHYVLDALPHFESGQGEHAYTKKWFHNYLKAEFLVCVLIVAVLFWLQPAYWLLASVCAFVAAAPDLASIKRFVLQKDGKHYNPGRYARFASKIQWFEKPIGAVVEVFWAIAMLAVILPIVF